MPWAWNETENQWQDEQGKLIPLLALLDLVWQRIRDGTTYVTSLAPLALPTTFLWQREMMKAITREYIIQFLLARGGLKQMTPGDWDLLRELLDEQRGFLSQFANELPSLTEGQIEARSKLYIRSAQQAFWRARGISLGWPTLPAYPGDCSTQCCTNCRCYWHVERVGGSWHAYWRLRPAEHCVDCIERAVAWNPLVIEE